MSDTLIFGGTILTMDSTAPDAEAVLLRDGHIAAVGDLRAVRSQATAQARELDLRGRTLVPGFNDAHTHFAFAGINQTQLDLSGMNKEQILSAVAERSAELPAGRVLAADNWDYPHCPDPHISDLDRVAPDRPVYLSQFSGHGAWVNTAFLRKARILHRKKDWKLGGVDRDQRGDPTGILREPGNAPGIMRFYIGRFLNRALVNEGLDKANEIYAEKGITSIQDNTWIPWHLRWIRSRVAAGSQRVRMSCWSYGKFGLVSRWFESMQFDPDWYAYGPRKFFLDGAFSSRTALMSEPYADAPTTTGSGLSVEQIERFLTVAARQGRQTASHSIGDEATHRFAEAAARVARSLPNITTQRHRIEHAQLVQERDFERIASLGLVVSAQPHAAATPEKDRVLIGDERLSRAYPYRSILDAGIPLAFGSDYPGEATFDPILGIHLAVNLAGDQAITPMEALRAYTAGGAYAEFREHDKGQIRTGFVADLAVISADPTSVPPQRIKDIVVEKTILAGESTFERTQSKQNTLGAATIPAGD